MLVLMMNYKIAQKVSPEHFNRRFGVYWATFKHLVKALNGQIASGSHTPEQRCCDDNFDFGSDTVVSHPVSCQA
jgi:hypothetical protein